VSATPKRYQFDNHQVPTFEPRPLPVQPPTAPVEQLYPYPEYSQQPVPTQTIHVHQAPPDRTVQRLALGAGAGGGAVAGAVYFGPLLVASLWSIAIIFAVGGLVLAVIVRGITAILGTEQPKGKRRR
jgi:hypothetical protein